ncbi:hypothetical protein GGR57DRAFT_514594 [Xylariaceae sp. FL1272]|nr:hypothetical protein GGR57DRAFT_514594 [Xylariaceae sp. FL1272]
MSHTTTTDCDWLINPEELSSNPDKSLEGDQLGYKVAQTWVVKPTPKHIVAAIKAAVESVNNAQIEVDPEPLLGGNGCMVYDVSINGKKFVIRVLLPNPWYRGYKVENEVATLRYARKSTELRPPIVFAYQSTRFNPLGYEWILMSKMPGQPLSQVWSSLEFEKKEHLVKGLAASMAKAIKKQVRDASERLQTWKIGSLYDPSTCSSLPKWPGHNSRDIVCDMVSSPQDFKPVIGPIASQASY